MLKRSSLVAGIVLALMVSAITLGCTAKPEEPATPAPETAAPEQSTPATPAETPDTATTEDPSFPVDNVTELKTEDLVEGDGAEAKQGSAVTVNYTGWLTDGTKFDSSLDSGQPFQFTIGEQKVISGWEEGIAGMKVGGTRLLIIPPDKGYGAQGYPGVIPGDATLVFKVELLDVQ